MISQKIFNSQNIIITLILVLGFFLRFYNLENVPAGFFADEAAVGYDAYRISETGRDEYGNFLPIFFWSFEDYKRPLSIYTDLPFILTFKLTEVAVRLQAAFFGMITIIFVYLIGKEIISKNCGLWAAFIAATLPWFVHYSRVGLDYSTYIAMFSGSTFFLIKATSNKQFVVPFFIFLGLTFYSYQPAALFVPILLVIGAIIYGKRLLKYPKYLLIGCFLFILLSLPMSLQILKGEGFSRLNKISIFSNNNLTMKAKINKFISNYLYQLSPEYLLNKGDANNNRSFSGGLAPILPLIFPFLIFGLIELFKKIKYNYSQLLLFLTIVYPLGGAITMDGPFSGRSFIGALLAALITGIGINSFIKIFSRKVDRILVSILLIIAFMFNLIFFVRFYFIDYPMYSSDFWGWQYGPKEIIKYFVKVQNSYDDLYLNGEFNGSEVFYKFYDPLNLCNSKCKIDTFYVNPYIVNPKRKQLFALSPDTLSKSPMKEKFSVKKTIYYPNNTIAFLIGEIVQ